LLALSSRSSPENSNLNRSEANEKIAASKTKLVKRIAKSRKADLTQSVLAYRKPVRNQLVSLSQDLRLNKQQESNKSERRSTSAF
jgi:hypothetical protein